jgi:hypothetical protein
MLKNSMGKFSLVAGVVESYVATTRCAEVMSISMLISDFVFVCMLLICCLCLFTTTMFERDREREGGERDQVKL